MSTSTHRRDDTAAIPAPRAPAAPEVDPPAHRFRITDPGPGEQPSLFGRHGWLVPVLGIACVLAIFISMVLLTWAAGGGTPFDR